MATCPKCAHVFDGSRTGPKSNVRPGSSFNFVAGDRVQFTRGLTDYMSFMDDDSRGTVIGPDIKKSFFRVSVDGHDGECKFHGNYLIRVTKPAQEAPK